MLRRLFLLFLACFLLGGGLCAQNSKAVKKLQSERAALKKQIDNSQQLLKSTKRDVKTQLSNLLLLDSEIGRQQKYVEHIAYEADSLARRIDTLQVQLESLQRELDECKRKFQRSLMYMHRNRSAQNKLMFIFSADNFKQAYRRMRYVEEFARYQRAQGEVLKTKELAVRKAKAELLVAKGEKDRMLADGRAEQKKLEGQKAERQTMVNKLKKEQKKLQTSITQSQKKYNQLNAKIDKLIQEEIAAAERRRKEAERKRKAAEEKARREAAKKNGGKAGSGSSSSGKTATPKFREPNDIDRQLSTNFTANKGKLPMPITGGYVISSRFGSNSVEGLRGVQLDNKGINITGRRGAQARCVFNGEVTSVFSFGGLMNVIVRHGSYITVYCNLSSVNVRLGQKVTTKQILGTIAPDASGNSTLHFQLRRETTKLDPEPWLAR